MKKAKPSEIALVNFPPKNVLDQLITWAEEQGFKLTMISCFYCNGKGEVESWDYEKDILAGMRQCYHCAGGGYIPD